MKFCKSKLRAAKFNCHLPKVITPLHFLIFSSSVLSTKREKQTINYKLTNLQLSTPLVYFYLFILNFAHSLKNTDYYKYFITILRLLNI